MKMANILERVNLPSLFRAVPSLSSNFLNLLLEQRDGCAPFYIFWLLSYRCNLKCRHCDWVWSKTGPEDLNRELSKDEKIEIADQIARSWTWGVTLSGGEPLLEPSLPGIIRRLKGAHKYVNVCTNGLLLEKWAKDLIDMNVDAVTVSLDSHRRDVHDNFRGVKGTFDAVLSGLEALKVYRKKHSPRIVIKGTIASCNYLEVCDYVAYFSSYADAIEFQPVQNNFGHQVKEMGVLFNTEHEQQFRIAMDELIRKFPDFDSAYYRNMADFLFNPQELLRSVGFKCLFSSAMAFGIDPYGDAGGCLGRNFIGGNLRERPLLDIWRSNKNFEDQKRMRSRSSQCMCWNNSGQIDSYVGPIHSFFHRK
jgi:MoaA/NifB/PqqE/SkfB family radical SAM enzyme